MRIKQGILAVCCLASVFGWAQEANPDEFLSYQKLHQMIVGGDVNVILGESKSPNIVEYDPSEATVKMTSEGLLSLQSKPGITANVVIRSEDQFKALKRIVVRDSATLVAKDIRSEALDVDSKTAGSLKIEGVMNLNHLLIDNVGESEIYWVDSHSLDVDIKQGKLVLGGRADRLTMRATNVADLDASGLISNYTWVAASGTSSVEVFPLKTLYAYSKESAVVNVKYKPEMYVPVNQAPSVIVLNFIEMEKRVGAVY